MSGEEIDLDSLLLLSDEQLKDLGLPLGPRAKIRNLKDTRRRANSIGNNSAAGGGIMAGEKCSGCSSQTPSEAASPQRVALHGVTQNLEVCRVDG